jgi:hypothetical protein
MAMVKQQAQKIHKEFSSELHSETCMNLDATCKPYICS